MPTFLIAGWNWFANNPVAQKIALWTALIVAVLFGYDRWKKNVQAGVRRQMNEQSAREQAEAQRDAAITISTITKETMNDSIRADAAVRDLPRASSVDQLREQAPDVAGELFGSTDRGS